jgi:hypothetical protein
MANSTIPNLPIFAGTPSGTEPMETVQSSLSVQIPSQKIADLATIVIPLTKTAMDGLVSASQVSSYKLYLITNADSSTRRLLVKGLTTTTLEDTAIDMSTGEVGTYVLSTDTFTATSGGGNASITPIAFAVLQALETAGTLSLTTLYIIIDAAPFELMCKAETVSQLSKTATVVDSVYSGTVSYDLQTDTWSNGTIYDGNGNVWNGVLPSATTLGAGSDGNIFYSDCSLTAGTGCNGNILHHKASGVVMGDDCEYNVFEQRSGANTLGNSCVYNTFKQGTNAFIFGDNLSNVTIEAGTNGANYTATPDYNFLYNNTSAATIFTDGIDNYHRYYDPANDRIVLRNLSTPLAAPTYIGGGTGGGDAYLANDQTFTGENTFAIGSGNDTPVTITKGGSNAALKVTKSSGSGDAIEVADGSVSIADETASTIAHFDADKRLKSLATSTYPSLTELSYVKGATSAIQTQLNNKVTVFASATDGTASSGTSNTISHSQLIPANTFAVDDMIRFNWRLRTSGTALTRETRMYFNTSNSLTGATLMATVSLTNTLLVSGAQRFAAIKNATTNTEVVTTTTNQLTDYNNFSTAATTLAIDWTADVYIIFACNVFNAGDSARVSMYSIEKL